MDSQRIALLLALAFGAQQSALYALRGAADHLSTEHRISQPEMCSASQKQPGI